MLPAIGKMRPTPDMSTHPLINLRGVSMTMKAPLDHLQTTMESYSGLSTMIIPNTCWLTGHAGLMATGTQETMRSEPGRYRRTSQRVRRRSV